jgi:hypothetical protein
VEAGTAAAFTARFASDFFAAQRAFAAAASFFFVAGRMGFRALFAAGEATGADLADFAVVGATAAFFAAAFAALFFFAHRFCCASAIRWRASGLTVRFVVAEGATGAVMTLFTAAGFTAFVAVLTVFGTEAEPFNDSNASIA